MSAPALAAEAATIGRRVGAYLIDGVVATVVVVAGVVVSGFVTRATATAQYPLGTIPGVLAGAAIVLVVALAWMLVFTAMQGGGGSIGQRLVGIRVADAGTGLRIGFWRALLRNLVWALLCSIIVGYFTPLFDAGGRRQGWHDLAARAVVVSRGVDASARADGRVQAPAVAAPVVPAPVVPAPNPFLAASAPSAAVSAAAATPAPIPVPAQQVAPAQAAPAQVAPAQVAPAIPVAATGLIARVPGVGSPAAAAAAPPTAVPTVAASVPAQVPPASAPHPATDEVELTRASAPRPPARPAALIALTWDDGTNVAVHGRTLFGRNPEREAGAAAVAVRDETLSLSKTHFEIGGDAAQVWLVDRHSTNGTTLVRGGVRETVIPGVRVPLRAGDRLEFGDRTAILSADAGAVGAA